MRRIPRTLAALAALVLPGMACAAEWVSADDPGTLAFAPRFEGQEIPGVFQRFEVRLTGEPGQGEPAALAVRVDITSAAFDDGDVQDEVGGPDWFDVARHPVAEFRSERIEPAGDGAWQARGELTIKGSTRELTLPFRFERDGGAARIAGALVLDRRAFDIGSGEWAEDDSIAFAVPVRFDARLRLADAP